MLTIRSRWTNRPVVVGPLVLIAIVLTSAWAWARSAREAEARRVREVVAGIIAADNARDLERVLASYADDAILLPPGDSPVRGKAAIRPRYETLFSRFSPQIVGEIEELHVDDQWAFVLGYNRGKLNPIASGEARTLNDVYLMVLTRSPDGAWRIARLMWHAGPPAA